MATLLTAEEVTLQNLISPLTENGFSPVPLNDAQVWLHSESGIGFRITILHERQFIHVGTYLPLSRTKTKDEKIAFSHHLNSEVFLAKFSLDDEGDLLVSYTTSYQFGLVTQQFIALVNRFSSLLEWLVHAFDPDGLIDFSTTSVSIDASENAGPLLH